MEDDRTSSQAMHMLLTRLNCDVCVVDTVRQAAEFLALNQPHFVILDLMLPDGDGADILRQLRSDNSASKVIVTTAMNDGQRLLDCQALSPYRFVRKPFDVVDLLKAMNMM